MTCGIYQLTFKSGSVYIGQSVNIQQRWQQHQEKFEHNKAAKLLQQEYNKHGAPCHTVLFVCHRDYLNIMESMYINSIKLTPGVKLLNTTIPKDYTNSEINVIQKHEHYLTYSVIELIQQLSAAKANVVNMQHELDKMYAEGIQLPVDVVELQNDNLQLKEQVVKLLKINQYLSKMANRSWWERLFS